MKTNSGEEDVAPKTRKKGGRPRKTSGANSPGNVVAEKPIVKPATKRDYRITSRGEVLRILANGRKQPVKPWFSGPYECVYIYGVEGANKYGRKKAYVHRLVADHFEKKGPGENFVHHKDGNERNNTTANLEWTTLDKNLKARKYFYKDKKGTVQRRRGK